MSIITRPAPKSSRTTRNPALPFGQGILPSYPTYRAPASFEDMAWAAQFFGEQSARDSEPAIDWDAWGAEVDAIERMQDGYSLF